ncbi:MAG TPA: cyclic lactone autoinducer peptide [Clostridium sp.]
MQNKYSIIAGVVTIVATMFTGVFASWLWSYQPQTPKCLK